jgi:hypothetical protein
MKDHGRWMRDLLARTPSARLSNILMRIPDKVCAAGFSALPDDTQNRLYALVGGTKAARIREEIRIEGRRRTSAVARARLLRSFLAYFEHRAPRAPSVWVRPIRRRGDTDGNSRGRQRW